MLIKTAAFEHFQDFLLIACEPLCGEPISIVSKLIIGPFRNLHKESFQTVTEATIDQIDFYAPQAANLPSLFGYISEQQVFDGATRLELILEGIVKALEFLRNSVMSAGESLNSVSFVTRRRRIILVLLVIELNRALHAAPPFELHLES